METEVLGAEGERKQLRQERKLQQEIDETATVRYGGGIETEL